MKRFLILLTTSMLLSTGVLSLGLNSSTLSPGGAGDMVLYRYDANRTGRAPFVSNIVEP